jgi:hypothetical protein
VGQFDDVAFTAEPGGLPAAGRHLPFGFAQDKPPGGWAAKTPRGRCPSTLLRTGHGARREIHISKMTHYP